MLKRHEIEILLKASHSKAEAARLAGISLRSVNRIAAEAPVVHVDDAAEREKRRIGRPSKVEDFRKVVLKILEEKPDLPSLEILRRVREAGYQGGKTALYALVASVRPKEIKPLIRFEGLPGEFSQHDFGEVEVAFLDGSSRRIHFFASRLKYSRLIRVSVVKDQTVESLVRNLAEHLDSWGGAPLMCVFDRPKTVALKWRRNGFTGSVGFTCSVSPIPVNDPPTCFVFPFSVALSATTTSATVALKISTTAGLSSGLRPGNGPNTPGYFAASAGIVVACVFLLGTPKQRRRWDALLGLIVLVFVGLALTSCASGHGGSSQINLGTPAGNYSVTVTASSGAQHRPRASC
jgi:transposase